MGPFPDHDAGENELHRDGGQNREKGPAPALEHSKDELTD